MPSTTVLGSWLGAFDFYSLNSVKSLANAATISGACYNRIMKLLLTSAGLTTEEIIKTYEQLVGKKRQNIKVVAIEDAARAETGDMAWFETEKQHVLDNSKSLEILPLQTQPLTKVRMMIESADVIYCFGGNADYLTKVLEDTGLAQTLPEILETKVWVGSSAGSCVMCHKESGQTAREVFQENPEIDHYLDIVPAVLLPHYHGWFKFEEPEILREAKVAPYPVYAISDQAALKVILSPHKASAKASEKSTITTVGEDYYINLGEEINQQVHEVLGEAGESIGEAAEVIGKLFKH